MISNAIKAQGNNLLVLTVQRVQLDHEKGFSVRFGDFGIAELFLIEVASEGNDESGDVYISSPVHQIDGEPKTIKIP